MLTAVAILSNSAATLLLPVAWNLSTLALRYMTLCGYSATTILTRNDSKEGKQPEKYVR